LPDIRYGATQGDTIEEALRQAEDMLEEAISEEAPLPSPAKGRPVVRLPPLTAAKLELYRAMATPGSTRHSSHTGWACEGPVLLVGHLPSGPPASNSPVGNPCE
jgi:hypothetical protein